MNAFAKAPILLTTVAILLLGCDQSCKFPQKVFTPDIPKEQTEDFTEISKSLDRAVELILPHLTEQDRKRIRDYGDENEIICLMKGEFLHARIGSLRIIIDQELIRLGIFHGDDIGGIIDTAVSRKIRNKPFDVQKVIKSFRGYWAEQDVIAPLDTTCPECKRKMTYWIGAEVEGKQYFGGQCDRYHEFYFHHEDGWRSVDEISGKRP